MSQKCPKCGERYQVSSYIGPAPHQCKPGPSPILDKRAKMPRMSDTVAPSAYQHVPLTTGATLTEPCSRCGGFYCVCNSHPSDPALNDFADLITGTHPFQQEPAPSEYHKLMEWAGKELGEPESKSAPQSWEGVSLPKCPQYVAHPQAVWFEIHWRPIIERLTAENAELREKLNAKQK